MAWENLESVLPLQLPAFHSVRAVKTGMVNLS
jgi:hypothetical protein